MKNQTTTKKLLLLTTLLSLLLTPPLFSNETPVTEGYFPGAEGVRIYYREIGKGEETAIYLHGGPGFDMHDGGFELNPIAKNRRIIVIDQRGGGKSEHIADPAMLHYKYLVEDIQALRKHFKITGKMTVMGQSWGSGLALLYANAYPEHVKRLVLLSPMPLREDMFNKYRGPQTGKHLTPADGARFGEILKIDQSKLSDAETVKLCREYISIIMKPYFSEYSDLKNMNGDYCGTSPAALRIRWSVLGKIMASIAGYDWSDIAQKVAVPTLITEGTLTRVPLSTTREWAVRIPNARLVLVPKAGHLVWVDNPDPLFRAIETFLQGRWPKEARMVEALRLDLVSFYSFDGDLRNHEDNYHDGVSQSPVAYGADRFGNANMSYVLGGNGNGFRVENPGWYVTNSWSWGAWVRVNGAGDRDFLIQDGTAGGAKVGLKNGRLAVVLNGIQVLDSERFSVGEWQHVVVVHDRDRLSLYRNGELVGVRVSRVFEAPTGSFLLGEGDGEVDDFYVFARSLNEGEVESLYQRLQVGE